MGGTPNQGQNSDPSGQYGGYTGYTPPQSTNPKDDPYNAQWYGQPQGGSQGTAQDSAGYSAGQQQYTAGQQQQQYYQPPLSATNRNKQQQQGTGGASATSVFGLSARIAALLSYLFTWVGGLFFLLFERKNQFVRYSAAQSVTIFGPLFVVYVLLILITHIPLLGALLAPILACLINIVLIAGGLLWLFLMIQAYRGVAVRIPIVSAYADALLARFSGRRSKTSV